MSSIPASEIRPNTTYNLIIFDMLFDMDLAVLKVLLDNTKMPDLFNDRVNNINSMNEMRNILLFREQNNPLSVLLSDKYVDSADTILKELEEAYAEKLVEYAQPNSIANFVYHMSESGVIENTILCKDKWQVEKVKNNIPKAIPILDIPTNIDKYHCLFVKYVTDLLAFKGIGGKHIYLYNARFNLTDKFALDPIAIYISKMNRINTIDPFKGLRVPNLLDSEKEQK